MNAGAHKSQVSEVLESARICFLEKGRIEAVPKDRLQMDYRRTVVGRTDVVCSAIFKLQEAERDAIWDRMKDHRLHRIASQPADQPNAGSFFRNPPGSSAGRLIEAAGLKGARVGGAEVSLKHANFLVARPGAKAQDVYDLMAMVQSRVLDASGLLLVPEVRIIGPFDTSRGEVRSE